MHRRVWRRRTRRSWGPVRGACWLRLRWRRARRSGSTRRPPAAPRRCTGAWHEPSAANTVTMSLSANRERSASQLTSKGRLLGGGVIWCKLHALHSLSEGHWPLYAIFIIYRSIAVLSEIENGCLPFVNSCTYVFIRILSESSINNFWASCIVVSWHVFY